MENENYIKKWLEGTLSEDERRVFEASAEFKSLKKFNKSIQAFKAPDYNVEKELELVNDKKAGEGKVVRMLWLKPMLKVAAVFIVLIGVSFYFYLNVSTSIQTSIAERANVYLPDSSQIILNATTNISYKKRYWDFDRQVKLNGEAFFKVTKGSKFDVVTTSGTVSVLGTQFNVKNRDDYFEVVCYEGLVEVQASNQTTKLPPGHSFRITNGKIEKRDNSSNDSPAWINNESSFLSIPFAQVIMEFERQYDVSIITRGVDLEQLFTGKFIHNNQTLALQAISLPLNLKFETEKDNRIILSGKGD